MHVLYRELHSYKGRHNHNSFYASPLEVLHVAWHNSGKCFITYPPSSYHSLLQETSSVITQYFVMGTKI